MEKIHLTNDDFQYFKTECERFLRFFGMLDWRCFVDQGDTDGNLAQVTVNYHGRTANIQLDKEWSEQDYSKEMLSMTAFHEVLEIMLNPIRKVSLDTDLPIRERAFLQDTEAHVIIRRLESTVFPLLTEEG